MVMRRHWYRPVMLTYRTLRTSASCDFRIYIYRRRKTPIGGEHLYQSAGIGGCVYKFPLLAKFNPSSLFIRRHRWQAIRLLCDRCYTVPLSVCLSRSCIVLKRQMMSARFLLHTTAPCLSQIELKFGLSVTHFSLNFAPNWFERRASDTFDSKLRPNHGYRQHNGHKREPIWNHVLSNGIYHRWPPTTSLLQNGGPKCTAARPTSWRVLPPGEYDRKYRQDFFCTWAMSLFAKLFSPLFYFSPVSCPASLYCKPMYEQCYEKKSYNWKSPAIENKIDADSKPWCYLSKLTKNNKTINRPI